MGRKKLLKHLVWLMFFIFTLSFLDTKFYWSSLFWYFDMILHTLGGLWVGFFFFYLFLTVKPSIPALRLFWLSLFATLFVGIVWEFYELFLDSIITFRYYSGDGASDLFFDILGFGISWVYYLKVVASLSFNRIQS